MDSALLRVIKSDNTKKPKQLSLTVPSSTTAPKVGLIFRLFFFDLLFFIINNIWFVGEKRCLDFNLNLKMQSVKWKMLFQVK